MAGGKPETMAKGPSPVRGLAASADGVYWTAGERQAIGSDEPPPSTGSPAPMPTVAVTITSGLLGFARAKGGAPMVLAHDRRELGMAALDDGFLYWVEENALMRMAKAGGPATLVCAGNGHVSQPAFDASHAYVQLGAYWSQP